MAFPSCDYAAPDNLTVNYHFDADSVTVRPIADDLISKFLATGGVIGPYVVPPPPDTSAQTRRAAFLADANYQALLAQLKAATPAQVSTYITTNVTDLPSARAMLIKMALILALVANGS